MCRAGEQIIWGKPQLSISKIVDKHLEEGNSGPEESHERWEFLANIIDIFGPGRDVPIIDFSGMEVEHTPKVM